MADNNQLKQAKNVFRSLCGMLDNLDWTYDANEEDLTITTGTKGEDLPISLHLEVDADKQIIIIFSQLPFEVPEDQRVLMAIAVSLANHGLPNGSFDYNLANGVILFRITSSYINSLISENLLKYLLAATVVTVDKYNDKFFPVSKENMGPDEVIKFIQ